MNSEAFLSLYLKEIGVQTPVSSFLPIQENGAASVQTSAPQETVSNRVSYPIAEPAPDQATENIAEVAEPQLQAAVQVYEAVAEQISQPEATQPERIQVRETADDASQTAAAHDLKALQIQAEACKACELVHSRNQLVFGSGNREADLVFIGDSPGRDEDIAGLPFVGRSGELFDRMLAAIQLNRETVYLMNGVKCRPLHSRAPKPEEFAQCERWLLAQLELLQPKLICMLGRVVAESLLKSQLSLAELRAGQFSFRGIPVLVIDHPSYLLRSQKHKQRAWQDLIRLQKTYQKLLTV